MIACGCPDSLIGHLRLCLTSGKCYLSEIFRRKIIGSKMRSVCVIGVKIILCRMSVLIIYRRRLCCLTQTISNKQIVIFTKNTSRLKSAQIK